MDSYWTSKHVLSETSTYEKYHDWNGLWIFINPFQSCTMIEMWYETFHNSIYHPGSQPPTMSDFQPSCDLRHPAAACLRPAPASPCCPCRHHGRQQAARCGDRKWGERLASGNIAIENPWKSKKKTMKIVEFYMEWLEIVRFSIAMWVLPEGTC